MLWALIGLLLAAVPDAPTIESLDAAAKTTVKRLETDAASWTTTHQMPNGRNCVVHTQQSPECTRFELSMEINGQRQPFGTMTCQGGKSYLEDPRGRFCYRQHESPFFVPSTQMFLASSGLNPISSDVLKPLEILGISVVDKGLVKVRYRGLQEAREGAQQLVDKMKEFQAQLKAAGRAVPAEQLRSLDSLEQKLKDGFELIIDPGTGLLMEVGLGDRGRTYSDFQWVDAATAATWKIRPDLWPECVSSFSAAEMPDVIQIGYSAIWRPGAPGRDTDCMLLHTKTGRFYRVPYPNGYSLSGCFSPDKSKVYVIGPTGDEGGLNIAEISIETALSRSITAEKFPMRVWFFPAVSPDGKTLAACGAFQGRGLSSQIMLFDLDTLAAKPLGKPDDFAFLQWHPDGMRLYAAVRTSDPNGKQLSSLCRIDLDGTVTVLRQGFFPCLLSRQQRLLFEDRSEGKFWKTCDLDGGDVKQAGDGLKEFGFPTAFNDDRIIMMKFAPPLGPRPFLLDPQTFEATPIPAPAGLWTLPSAR